MRIFKATVAHDEKTIVVLTLDQLGASTKPYFLCQVNCHGPHMLPIGPPITFFLAGLADPTKAVNACVSLFRGFYSVFKSSGLAATLDKARELSHEMQWEDNQRRDFQVIESLCYDFEVKNQAT